jgi:hypothetical protein
MALSDCELLGCSVGLAGSDVIFKSRTLDYITHTYNGEKKLRQHIQLHIGAYPFFAVFVMWVETITNILVRKGVSPAVVEPPRDLLCLMDVNTTPG